MTRKSDLCHDAGVTESAAVAWPKKWKTRPTMPDAAAVEEGETAEDPEVRASWMRIQADDIDYDDSRAFCCWRIASALDANVDDNCVVGVGVGEAEVDGIGDLLAWW